MFANKIIQLSVLTRLWYIQFQLAIISRVSIIINLFLNILNKDKHKLVKHFCTLNRLRVVNISTIVSTTCNNNILQSRLLCTILIHVYLHNGKHRLNNIVNNIINNRCSSLIISSKIEVIIITIPLGSNQLNFINEDTRQYQLRKQLLCSDTHAWDIRNNIDTLYKRLLPLIILCQIHLSNSSVNVFNLLHIFINILNLLLCNSSTYKWSIAKCNWLCCLLLLFCSIIKWLINLPLAILLIYTLWCIHYISRIIIGNLTDVIIILLKHCNNLFLYIFLIAILISLNKLNKVSFETRREVLYLLYTIVHNLLMFIDNFFQSLLLFILNISLNF